VNRVASAANVATVLAQLRRPKRAVITAGMPYANGGVHLGHLAGALLPPDIFARWSRMLIGQDNVLFVCGTDEHGSASEIAALQAGVPIREFVDRVHEAQKATIGRYGISLDIYSGTSQPDCFPLQKELSHDFLTRLRDHGLLEKRTTRQWWDAKMQRFLPDRFVHGRCPNPKCENNDAFSDECDRCGHKYDANELLEPRSTISDAVPVLRETVHWWLDMAAVSGTLRSWIHSKAKTWRPAVLAEVLDYLMPSLRFEGASEDAYKGIRESLPKHRAKYGPKRVMVLQFENETARQTAQRALSAQGVDARIADEWAHRPITRDIAWGIPITEDPELSGKTLYVWPDSLIAPISFCKLALAAKGKDPALYASYWRDPDARITQFLGQDNVFFYVLMQGAMWLGTQADPHRLPVAGELQLTDVVACRHLLVGGEKMSKSRGNFFTGDQLLDDRGYSVDQIRYYLATLGLADKPSDFDFDTLDRRNEFLAGPMNAAFERPISAAHSKFGGRVPEGRLLETVTESTARMIARYVRSMERADYPNLLYEIENYARTINSLFTQYKPHDDRHPLEGRRDALYTAFYVLKNIMIMLHPFVPTTMDRVRESLRLPPHVFCVDELGSPIRAGHEVGSKQEFFPPPPAAA